MRSGTRWEVLLTAGALVHNNTLAHQSSLLDPRCSTLNAMPAPAGCAGAGGVLPGPQPGEEEEGQAGVRDVE